ncbi:MAG: hypothetical protein WC635_03025 [Bacteriovorax sp.]
MKNKLLVLMAMFGLIFVSDFAPVIAAKASAADSKTSVQNLLDENAFPLKSADSSRLGVLFQDGAKTYRLDLTIADLMDQVTLALKNKSDFNEQLAEALKDKPLENFPLWFAKLQELAGNNEDVARVMNRLIVQTYDQKGRAITEDVEVKGLIRKIVRIRSYGIYGNYLNDPEGEAFSRYFSLKKRAPFMTSLLTVTKANKFKNDLIKERREFYKNYISLLWAQEERDAQTYRTETKNIRVIDKSNPKEIVSVKIRVKDDFSDDVDRENKKELRLEKRKTEGWFNAIYSRSDKREILKYLQIHLQLHTPSLSIPEVMYNGEPHILLTPSFLHAHQKIIEPILKTYNYQKLVLQGDDEHLTRVSKWVKNHFEEVQNAGITFESDRPSRDEILNQYEALMSSFPDRPWEPETVMQDGQGEAVLLVGVPLKALYGIGKGIKKFAKVENLASIGTALVVTAATHNPIAGAYAAAAVGNTIKVLKNGKPITEAILPTLIEGTLYAIPASGFIGGQIPRALFLGGSSGLAHSLMTGQDPVVGTLVGAGLQLVETALPARVVNLTVPGIDAGSAAANAMVELAQSAAKGAVQGAVTQAISEDGSMTVGEAARKNALLNVGGTAVVIAIFGPRMRPISVTEARLLEEKNYQAQYGHSGEYTEDQYLRTTQRLGRYSLRQFFSGGNRGLFYGKGVYIAEGQENIDQTMHEQSHNQQSLERGSVKFILDYLIEAAQHGNRGEQIGGSNSFEHYEYL